MANIPCSRSLKSPPCDSSHRGRRTNFQNTDKYKNLGLDVSRCWLGRDHHWARAILAIIKSLRTEESGKFIGSNRRTKTRSSIGVDEWARANSTLLRLVKYTGIIAMGRRERRTDSTRRPVRARQPQNRSDLERRLAQVTCFDCLDAELSESNREEDPPMFADVGETSRNQGTLWTS